MTIYNTDIVFELGGGENRTLRMVFPIDVAITASIGDYTMIELVINHGLTLQDITSCNWQDFESTRQVETATRC